MAVIKGFFAGFFSTLLFHQGLLAIFYWFDLVPVAPYNWQPVAPFDVPKVVSLAFWGGVWGLALWGLFRRFQGWRYWLVAIVLGAIGPTVVAMTVVFPLKGMQVTMATWMVGLLLNGAWGLGLALFAWPMGRNRLAR
ncbi:MAG: hypothetical protein R3292_13540 [Alcanivorax sp.]|nr:hypothetical protein [Alcanivorax sp.]